MAKDKLPVSGKTVLSALFLMCAISVMAQTDRDDMVRQDSIQEVVITGMRPAYNMSSPTPVQSLKRRDLERINSLSVADALRYFSGMQLKDYGGIGGLKTVNIRSMGANHVGVFYDGIQLGNAQNGTVDLGKFSLDNMEAIDMYHAQKSDIFQSAKDFGSAGTIYLTTVKPEFAEGEKTKLKVQMRTALFKGIETPMIYGLTNPSVFWQQKLNEKISGTISAEWTSSNGKYRFEDRAFQNNGNVAYDTVEIRQNSDINAVRVEGGLNGSLVNGAWTAKAYFYNSERGLPGATVRNKSWRDQRLSDRNFFLQSSFLRTFGKSYDFKLNMKYAYDYTRFVGTDVVHVDNQFKQQEFYLSAINLYRILPVWKVTLSTDFQHNKLDKQDNNAEFSYPQRYTGLAALATALDIGWLNVQASLLGTFVHETKKMSAAASDKTIFTPAVFASYRPFKTEMFYIRAFYKKIFRMPTFNDLYYTIIGSSVLKPEFVAQYNVGMTFERLFKHSFFYRVSAQTDVYYNKITDKIVAIPQDQQFRWTMLNLGKVEIRGIDVAADATCRIREVYVNTRLTYTYQLAHDVTRSTDSYYGDQIPYIPTHSGSVIVGGNYKKWSLNYSLIYTGERYTSQANIPENYLQPWYTSDLSLARQMNWKSAGFKITAEVNNLLNQYYAVILNYPMPGRNYRLTLTLNI